LTNNILVEILVRKIKNKEINPNTSQPFSINDIKIQEYKDIVQMQLSGV
jgi:hypothetical protein